MKYIIQFEIILAISLIGELMNRLNGDVGFCDIADHLTLAHVHSVTVIRLHGVRGRNAQVTLIFHHGKCPHLVNHFHIVIVKKISIF